MSFDFGILVENPGRVNFDNIYGLDGQYKGLLGKVAISGSAGCQAKPEVSAFRLDMNSTTILQSTTRTGRWRNRPGFHMFTLHLRHEPHDTFIDPVSSGFKKGSVFVNGRNLGRYWQLGPQKVILLYNYRFQNPNERKRGSIEQSDINSLDAVFTRSMASLRR